MSANVIKVSIKGQFLPQVSPSLLTPSIEESKAYWSLAKYDPPAPDQEQISKGVKPPFIFNQLPVINPGQSDAMSLRPLIGSEPRKAP